MMSKSTTDQWGDSVFDKDTIPADSGPEYDLVYAIWNENEREYYHVPDDVFKDGWPVNHLPQCADCGGVGYTYDATSRSVIHTGEGLTELDNQLLSDPEMSDDLRQIILNGCGKKYPLLMKQARKVVF